MSTGSGRKKKNVRKDWKKTLVVLIVLALLAFLIWKLNPDLLTNIVEDQFGIDLSGQVEDIPIIPSQEQASQENTVNIHVTGTLELHMIDVGQADSLLIRQGEHSMLIDCATSGSGDDVADYLKENGVSYIDVLVGTHPHDDHMGGMWKLLRAFYDEETGQSKIGVLYAPDNSEDDITTQWYEKFLEAVLDTNVDWQYPTVGETFYIGEAKVQILGPTQQKYSNKNNYSIALRISYGEVDILLTGDAEEDAEQEIMATGIELESEIMKAGHHGSDTSNSELFVDKVNPQYFLVSAGLDNKHNHPVGSVMERIKNKGITVYRTDENGTVIMTTDGTNIKFNTSPGDYLSGPELAEVKGK